MCKERPCWGTPQELEKIVQAGFGPRLMKDYWIGGGPEGSNINILCGAIPGHEGLDAPWWPAGQCTFLTNDGKCELHDLELKPSEGKIASCKKENSENLHREVAMTWNNEEAQQFISKWRKEKR